MTIYARPDELVFAESANPGEVVAFPDIERGWGLAFEQTEGKPPMEWFNDILRRQDRAIRYLLQRGVSEWSETEDYPAGARTERHGVEYTALVANVGMDPATSGAHWRQSAILTLSTAPAQRLANTIFVEDRQQILLWQTIGAFTGYASPDVGRWSWGTQPTPRPFETDLIGQTLDRADPKYAALHAWATASGRFVSSGSWTAGTFFFAEMGGTLFKVPDMRDMFLRATGTDIDTANARPLGTGQNSSFNTHSHSLLTQGGNTGSGGMVFVDAGTPGSPWTLSPDPNNSPLSGYIASTAGAGGTETRGRNAALHPRIGL